MRPVAFIAGVAVGLALLLLVSLTSGAAPSPWHLGEVTDLRTWWWGEVPTAPVVEGGYAICTPVGNGLQRCVVVSQGIYRRIVVDGVVWEDRRQRVLLPAVYVGRVQHLWLPQISRGTR